MLSIRLRLLSGLGLLSLSLSGCGGSDLVPVRGFVLLDDEPLAQASLAFLPEGEGQAAHSMTDAEGAFELETHDKPGAKPGTYRVTVTKFEFSGIKTPDAPKSLVPPIYRSRDQTPLTVTLPADGDLLLEVKSE